MEYKAIETINNLKLDNNELAFDGLRLFMTKSTFKIYKRAMKKFRKPKNMVKRLKNIKKKSRWFITTYKDPKRVFGFPQYEIKVL